MSIKILSPRIPCLGVVKIGGLNYEKPFKGRDKQTHYPPMKFDHFKIYTAEKDKDGRPILDADLMTKLGDKPKTLDIMLPFDDIDLSFRTELAYYRGSTRFCFGDGETAERLVEAGEKNGFKTYGKRVEHSPCGEECVDFQSRRCKPSGLLSFLFSDMPLFGGVYQFRSHGWQTVNNIEKALKMIAFTTGGLLAMIPLKLSVRVQKVQPKEGGAAQNAPVVTLYFDGPPSKLLEYRRELLQLRSEDAKQIRLLEGELIGIPSPEPTPDEAEEIAAEFFPDNDAERAQSDADDFIDDGAAPLEKEETPNESSEEREEAQPQASNGRKGRSRAPATAKTSEVSAEDASLEASLTVDDVLG